MLRVLLLALLARASLSENLVVYGSTGTAALTAQATASNNGPALPDHGLLGRLVYSPHDVFGCDTTATSLSTAFSKIIFGAVGESTVVLLERSVVGSDGACSFEDKVKAVQAAGASGAIIFDSVEEEGLVSMHYANPDEVTIPAVFVSAETGQVLLDALQSNPTFKPLTLLSAPPANGWLQTLRFEAISFTSGYLVLFLLTFPVALYNVIKGLKRRRLVELAYGTAVASPELKATLERALPEGTPPLPPSLGEANKSCCMRLHRFLGLVVLAFIYQLLFMEADDASEAGGPAAASRGSPQAARSFGYAMVCNAFLLAAIAVLLERALSCCCRCLCRPCRGSGSGSGSGSGAAEAETTTSATTDSPTVAAKEAAKADSARAATAMEGGNLYVALPPVAVTVKGASLALSD